MAKLEHLIDTYCMGWSDPSAEIRERHIRASLSDDSWYCDPRTGHRLDIAALLVHIAAVQASRPGATVLRTSLVDAHHKWARFAWHVVLLDGTTLPEGIDIVELSDDGAKLKSVLGFFGPLTRHDA